MSKEVVVEAVVAAGAGSLLIGLGTVVFTLFSSRGGRRPLSVEPEPELPPTVPMPKPKVLVVNDETVITSSGVYWALTVWSMILGVVLVLAPEDWFGPSWRYFDYIPHNGLAMGVVCLTLGIAQAGVLWRRGVEQYRTLSVLFFLSGFVYWSAGMILGAEGLIGHGGLMEAPFMMYSGGHQFAHSASLWTQYQQEALRNKPISGRHRTS